MGRRRCTEKRIVTFGKPQRGFVESKGEIAGGWFQGPWDRAEGPPALPELTKNRSNCAYGGEG